MINMQAEKMLQKKINQLYQKKQLTQVEKTSDKIWKSNREQKSKVKSKKSKTKTQF